MARSSTTGFTSPRRRWEPTGHESSGAFPKTEATSPICMSMDTWKMAAGTLTGTTKNKVASWKKMLPLWSNEAVKATPGDLSPGVAFNKFTKQKYN